ncbi:MAG: energy transducer TonB [Candidatus Kerfeldbacteria bacterium]|nr:energy transducer TonB [Candidatus Kerfeldbacteria bacterium]
MPYGAPELKAVRRKYMARATVFASGLWSGVYLLGLALGVLVIARLPATRIITLPYQLLPTPPPLTQQIPPPAIAIAKPAVATAGVAVPVPDAKAEPERTIATQQEMSIQGPTPGALGDSLVVAPPAEGDLPKLDDYVYREEEPALITDAAPVYPDIAREAQVEGTVLLRVLVGKNGRVIEVHIDHSIPMLDQAAVEAARKWVFKPALNNNRPVPVWVARQVRFSLH